MPSTVLAQLRELGENLGLARKRRREPRHAWAQRIGVSEPTLTRMEKGDPSVSMAVYATALWLMGRSQALPDTAAPEHDQGALEDAVRVAKARAVRKRPVLYGSALSMARPLAPPDAPPTASPATRPATAPTAKATP
jgi:DNA-binding XRE family transcriptional regulator